MIEMNERIIWVKQSHRKHNETGWLERWKKYKQYSDDDYIKCSNLSCKNEAMHGGHVIRINESDNKEYVVPLCVS